MWKSLVFIENVRLMILARSKTAMLIA